MFDWITIFISVTALVVSLWCNRNNFKFLKTDFDNRMASESLNNFVAVEQMIKDIPSAVQFHGISADDLTEAGLTHEEFSYMLSNITAGGIYYRTTKNRHLKFFGSNEYYDVMFQSEKTRRAWPIVKRCMAPSDYRNELDRLLDIHSAPNIDNQNHAA